MCIRDRNRVAMNFWNHITPSKNANTGDDDNNDDAKLEANATLYELSFNAPIRIRKSGVRITNKYFIIIREGDATSLFTDTNEVTKNYLLRQSTPTMPNSFLKYPQAKLEEKREAQYESENIVYGKTIKEKWSNAPEEKGEKAEQWKIIWEKNPDKSITFDEIKETVIKAMHRIPKGKYCYYIWTADKIKGFLSTVHVGKSGGGSGYAMRADDPLEIDYRWKIVQSGDDVSYLIAKLWSYQMKLDHEKVNIDPNFHPVNWPILNRQNNSKACFIEYYKKFKTTDEIATAKEGRKVLTKKNKPIDTMPNVPKISHSYQSSDLSKHVKGAGKEGTVYETFKIKPRNLRLWQKGDDGDGIAHVINTQELKERDDAGTVMGRAFRNFGFPEPTVSHMSATHFAKGIIEGIRVNEKNKNFAIKKDSVIEEQWKLDFAGEPILKTDQEWCHLFGHGDGGPEVLLNFVSGSKHCNTEQLAIEVGQRRVIHNKDINDSIRKNFKAKITAYLMPNSGLISSKEYSKNELQALLFSGSEASTNLFRDFFNDTLPPSNFLCTSYFQKGSIDTNKWKLKNDCIINLNALVKENKTSVYKAEIVSFKNNFLNHFYVYKPLGRWIRYKIFYNSELIFDHLFDAQSQSFSLHEAQLLDFTVEYCMYNALKNKVNIFDDKDVDCADAMSYYYKLLIGRMRGLEYLNSKEIVKDVRNLMKATKNLGNKLEDLQNQDKTYEEVFDVQFLKKMDNIGKQFNESTNKDLKDQANVLVSFDNFFKENGKRKLSEKLFKFSEQGDNKKPKLEKDVSVAEAINKLKDQMQTTK